MKSNMKSKTRSEKEAIKNSIVAVMREYTVKNKSTPSLKQVGVLLKARGINLVHHSLVHYYANKLVKEGRLQIVGSPYTVGRYAVNDYQNLTGEFIPEVPYKAHPKAKLKRKMRNSTVSQKSEIKKEVKKSSHPLILIAISSVLFSLEAQWLSETLGVGVGLLVAFILAVSVVGIMTSFLMYGE